MSWEFLTLFRRTYHGNDNWGELFTMQKNSTLEYFSYSYELPWKTFDSGLQKGKSKNNESRIAIGRYQMKPRNDGPKGWRLELEDTGHRSNIQLHRAHSSMFIEGCILPLTFNDRSGDTLSKGDTKIQNQSVTLMAKLKEKYDAMKVGKTGNPEILIAATLPAYESTTGSRYA